MFFRTFRRVAPSGATNVHSENPGWSAQRARAPLRVMMSHCVCAAKMVLVDINSMSVAPPWAHAGYEP